MKFSKLSMLSMVVAGSLALAACGESDEAATGSASATPAAKTASGSIGIEACDKYVNQYRSCIAKMPSEAQASMEQGLVSTIEGFKQSAASAKDATEQACISAYESAAPGMKAAGCDW